MGDDQGLARPDRAGAVAELLVQRQGPLGLPAEQGEVLLDDPDEAEVVVGVREFAPIAEPLGEASRSSYAVRVAG